VNLHVTSQPLQGDDTERIILSPSRHYTLSTSLRTLLVKYIPRDEFLVELKVQEIDKISWPLGIIFI
jgi:hypothetical protein